ncbi:hypothetical protein AB0J90_10935 [Micromonospora sp. NPDC049523]|uniref:hypothetical protein n=1 Tax=Micromonospora sp. NPDC049523 TaxID=3155921 RepID=UPI003441E241
MRFVAHTYSFPKDEDHPAEWEDGAGHYLGRGRGWFAVADGASSGFHVKEWAKRLVTGFVTQRLDSSDAVQNLIVKECERWSEVRDAPAREQLDRQWWEEAAPLRQDTAAAFVGLYVEATGPRTGKFRAFAVGDCCLMHVRGTTLLMSFPLSSPEAFAQNPALVYSRPEKMPAGVEGIQLSSGQLRPGDMLILASDRLSQCLLWHSARSDGAVWQALRAVNRPSFESLVRALRSHGSLEVDDVTLLRIAVLEE